MYRRLFYLSIFILFSVTHSGQQKPVVPAYKNVYKYAEKLYNDPVPTDRKDSLALDAYLKVIRLHKSDPDSILFDSYYKAGIYFQTGGKFGEAIPYLRKALSLQKQVSSISDSIMYLPNLYLGNSYYNISLLDSAVYYYQAAEQITRKFPKISGLERLYNTLGAVNYESGNYLQSSIYFEKALQMLLSGNAENIPLRVNYQSNLASSLKKMKEYDKAMNIYMKLLRYNTNKDEILHNIGSIYLEKDSAGEAIRYLKSVSYDDPNKLNDLALAYLKLNEKDSARIYLIRSINTNKKINGTRKNLQSAIAYKLSGDLNLSENHIDSSLQQYQQGIQQLVFSFNENNFRINPSGFDGQFSVIELFELLVAKAKAFVFRYEVSRDPEDLKSCLDTYTTVYKFTGYVTRTYESPEARLYLNNRKHLSHNQPIDVCLTLYKLTNNKGYVEKAFQYDEQNKASVLSLALEEAKIKNNGSIPDSLLMQEKQLKKKITMLSLQGGSIDDEKVRTELRDDHIKLAALQNRFNEYPGYRRFRYADNIYDLPEIQKIIPRNSAILSYHLGDTTLLTFLITKNSFKFYTKPIKPGFQMEILRLYQMIQQVEENNNLDIDSMSKGLYQQLIGPVEGQINNYDHLMIIPDDELSILPFEILKDNSGKYLINTNSLTYNYSCNILKESNGTNFDHFTPVLAMAPFAPGLPGKDLKPGGFPLLQESKNEVESIKGDRFIGANATKETFISKAHRYTTLHLATHAKVNDANPSESYIAFYPADSSSDISYKLFTSEIVDLPLNNTKLVLLSACETAAGQLVKGEGILSLTRAFSYAGCPNTIASLWKANDESTAFISQRFYHYLEKDKPIAVAMQKGIIDYLENDKIPARLKTPANWAHLRFIGNFQNDPSVLNWALIIVLAISGVAAIIYFLKRATSA